jgi:hypothetical protein
LAPSIETSSRTSHNFNVLIFALSSLDIPDDVLNVSEAICCCKLEHDLPIDF